MKIFPESCSRMAEIEASYWVPMLASLFWQLVPDDMRLFTTTGNRPVVCVIGPWNISSCQSGGSAGRFKLHRGRSDRQFASVPAEAGGVANTQRGNIPDMMLCSAKSAGDAQAIIRFEVYLEYRRGSLFSW